MKAHVIISQEYRLNSPSVFINIAGQYFGDILYPKSRNYPPVEYWKSASSSDEDRGFTIHEVEFTENEHRELIKLHNAVQANEAMINRTSWPHIPKLWKFKRGKEYLNYKAAQELQSAEITKENEKNAPFEKAMHRAYTMRKNLILSLIK